MGVGWGRAVSPQVPESSLCLRVQSHRVHDHGMVGEGSKEQATLSGRTDLCQGPGTPRVPDSEGSLGRGAGGVGRGHV